MCYVVAFCIQRCNQTKRRFCGLGKSTPKAYHNVIFIQSNASDTAALEPFSQKCFAEWTVGSYKTPVIKAQNIIERHFFVLKKILRNLNVFRTFCFLLCIYFIDKEIYMQNVCH